MALQSTTQTGGFGSVVDETVREKNFRAASAVRQIIGSEAVTGRRRNSSGPCPDHADVNVGAFVQMRRDVIATSSLLAGQGTSRRGC